MPANTYGRQVVIPLTNKSGGGVIAGDVVIVGTANNDAFTTTTASAFTGTVGVAQETIADSATGRVLLSGYAALINTTASVTRQNFGTTSTTVKKAVDAGSSRIAGTFCQFLTGGTTPDGIVFPADLGAGTGAPLTNIEYTLGADVTMTSTNTLYDGPSGTPAAGTYDITARLDLLNPSASAEIFTCRLYSGSTVIDEVEQSGYVQSSGIAVSAVLMARAVLDGATVVKASAMAAAGTSRVIKRDPATNSSGVHRASIIKLVRIA